MDFFAYSQVKEIVRQEYNMNIQETSSLDKDYYAENEKLRIENEILRSNLSQNYDLKEVIENQKIMITKINNLEAQLLELE